MMGIGVTIDRVVYAKVSASIFAQTAERLAVKETEDFLRDRRVDDEHDEKVDGKARIGEPVARRGDVGRDGVLAEGVVQRELALGAETGRAQDGDDYEREHRRHEQGDIKVPRAKAGNRHNRRQFDGKDAQRRVDAVHADLVDVWELDGEHVADAIEDLVCGNQDLDLDLAGNHKGHRLQDTLLELRARTGGGLVGLVVGNLFHRGDSSILVHSGLGPAHRRLHGKVDGITHARGVLAASPAAVADEQQDGDNAGEGTSKRESNAPLALGTESAHAALGVAVDAQRAVRARVSNGAHGCVAATHTRAAAVDGAAADSLR
mmetsp:Transcript_81728/g.162665  ORF Transcript_81728/g.162665 Transcript_81728/m.162665 type:complete len:319 (+) Transcript_81728:798-1754(+)